MSKLSVILLRNRKNYVVQQVYGSIRKKSSRCIFTDGIQIERPLEKSGNTHSELTENSSECSPLSREALGTQICKPFSLAFQSYRSSFSTTSSCLEKDNKCRQKPLSNKVVCDSDDSKRTHEDDDECKSSKKKKRKKKKKKRKKKRKKKKKKKRKHKKRRRSHDEDCDSKEKKHHEDVDCEDSGHKKSSPIKSWPVCKPRARRYRDPYKEGGAAGYIASLLHCGPKQCEMLMKFLVSFILFCLTSLVLFFYITDWKPWHTDEPPPQKIVVKKEVVVEEIVVEQPKKQPKKQEEKVAKQIEVLDVECVCDDAEDDNNENES